jgi:hypothetical protein
MIEAGQANAAQNQAGMYPCVGGAGGQGTIATAKAVSVGSHPLAGRHGRPTTPALTGTIEGAKNSIAAINTVLTALRVFIGRPQPLQACKPSAAH